LLLAAAVGSVFGFSTPDRSITGWRCTLARSTSPGPYYGFWSGFGSDLTEFGIIGVIRSGIYQLVKGYKCHEPGCLRVGTHDAAGGQFLLCYRHHPDFQGQQPSHEIIERLSTASTANDRRRFIASSLRLTST